MACARPVTPFLPAGMGHKPRRRKILHEWTTPCPVHGPVQCFEVGGLVKWTVSRTPRWEGPVRCQPLLFIAPSLGSLAPLPCTILSSSPFSLRPDSTCFKTTSSISI